MQIADTQLHDIMQGLSRVAVTEDVVDKMEKRLFGNGQPGILSDLDKRLKHLEKRENRLMGFVSAVVLFLELSHHAEWLFKFIHG